MYPKISIIVPVYKVEKYLNKCIDSILSQTFRTFELILVNDGSPDNCGKICDKYAKEDERVVVIHKTNGGQASARNAGLNISRGEYIGFIDSDDWIESNMFELLYNSCINNKSDISVIGIREIDENNKFLREYIPTGISLDEVLKRAYPCNKLFKKDLFKEDKFVCGRYYEDLELIPKLFIKSKNISIVKSIGYSYLRRSGSTTSSRDDKIIDNLWAYTRIKKYLIEKNEYKNYKNEFENGVKYFKRFYADILYDYPTDFLISHRKEIINYFKELDKIKFNEYIRFMKRHFIFIIKKKFSSYLGINK